MNVPSSYLQPGITTIGGGAALRSIEANGPPAIQQYLRVALRWKYVIIGVTIACIVLGLIVTFLMTPKYTAVATVEIAREASQVTNIQSVQRDTSVADQEFYQTQYGLLRSRALSERVATQLRLVDDPDFYKMFGSKSENPAFNLTNNRYGAAGHAERQRVAGEILLRNVSIDPTKLSRLVDIAFTSPRAPFSARVANAWAENFIQTNLERKVQATSYGRNLLERQLQLQKQRLDESQRQLVSYASSQEIIKLPAQGTANGNVTSERSIVADDLAALNTALTQATADRIEAEARYRAAGAGGASTEALGNAAINNLRQRRAELAAQYQQMMVQFEPGYPAAQALKSQIDQLDRAIGREEARVGGSIESAYRAASARENALQARVNQLKSNYLDDRRRSIQYNIYQQEVDTNRALYDGLLQRYKE
ncbi:GumC family protein, partial [uncultured Sphingomonas sp.]|uniref:GumC family protein n=1 Tax=uncultured Sphingomonas sp. TaxID=158754 RepID=UPI0025929579